MEPPPEADKIMKSKIEKYFRPKHHEIVALPN